MKVDLSRRIESKKKQLFRKIFTIQDPQMVWNTFYKKLAANQEIVSYCLVEGNKKIIETQKILRKLGEK